MNFSVPSLHQLAFVSYLFACVSLLASAYLHQLTCVSYLLACITLLVSACLRHLIFGLIQVACVSYHVSACLHPHQDLELSVPGLKVFCRDVTSLDVLSHKGPGHEILGL